MWLRTPFAPHKINPTAQEVARGEKQACTIAKIQFGDNSACQDYITHLLLSDANPFPSQFHLGKWEQCWMVQKHSHTKDPEKLKTGPFLGKKVSFASFPAEMQYLT